MKQATRSRSSSERRVLANSAAVQPACASRNSAASQGATGFSFSLRLLP